MPNPDPDPLDVRFILDEPLNHHPECPRSAPLVYTDGEVCCGLFDIGCGAVAKAHVEPMEPADPQESP